MTGRHLMAVAGAALALAAAAQPMPRPAARRQRRVLPSWARRRPQGARRRRRRAIFCKSHLLEHVTAGARSGVHRVGAGRRPPIVSCGLSGGEARRHPKQPIGIDAPEMLADERVRLDVLDALLLEAPLGRAHLLQLGFALDRRCAFAPHQPVPEVSQHPAAGCALSVRRVLPRGRARGVARRSPHRKMAIKGMARRQWARLGE